MCNAVYGSDGGRGKMNVLKIYTGGILSRVYDNMVMNGLGTVYAVVCNVCPNDIFR